MGRLICLKEKGAAVRAFFRFETTPCSCEATNLRSLFHPRNDASPACNFLPHEGFYLNVTGDAPVGIRIWRN
jgi:hypothetical protein